MGKASAGGNGKSATSTATKSSAPSSNGYSGRKKMTTKKTQPKESKDEKSVTSSSKEKDSERQTPQPRPKPRIDPSQINFNYDLRINGLSSLLNTYAKSTDKLKKLLAEECDLILECRVCRSLFRSLPNFISHKELYCKTHFHPAIIPLSQHIVDSSVQIEHHVHSSLTNPISKDTFKKKSERLEDVLSRLGPAVEMMTSAIPSLKDDVRDQVKANLTNANAPPPQKVQLVIQDRGKKEEEEVRNGGVVCQRKPGTELTSEEAQRLRTLRKSDTAVLDPTGKIMFLGAAGVVEDFVNRVVCQIQDKQEEENKKMKQLNCHTCQTVFESEKSLRTHARTHCLRKKSSKGKRKEPSSTTTQVPDSDSPSPSSSDAPDTGGMGENTEGNHRLAPPPMGVEEAESGSNSKRSPSPNVGAAMIQFMPTSPIFAFKSGRATNNSCSASLSAMSSPSLTLNSTTPVPFRSPLKRERPSDSDAISRSSKRLTLPQGQSSRLRPPPMTSLTLLMNKLKYSQLSPQSKPSTKPPLTLKPPIRKRDSDILERSDYSKDKVSPTPPTPPKFPSPPTIPPPPPLVSAPTHRPQSPLFTYSRARAGKTKTRSFLRQNGRKVPPLFNNNEKESPMEVRAVDLENNNNNNKERRGGRVVEEVKTLLKEVKKEVPECESNGLIS